MTKPTIDVDDDQYSIFVAMLAQVLCAQDYHRYVRGLRRDRRYHAYRALIDLHTTESIHHELWRELWI